MRQERSKYQSPATATTTGGTDFTEGVVRREAGPSATWSNVAIPGTGILGFRVEVGILSASVVSDVVYRADLWDGLPEHALHSLPECHA